MSAPMHLLQFRLKLQLPRQFLHLLQFRVLEQQNQ
nr:MAG TPA: hypothetical protein [Caudoviricetes sp.]